MTHTDAQLRQLVADGELSTSLLGDVCDQLGGCHQFLPAEVRCLDSTITLVGRAMPVVTADVFGPQKRPFGLLTDALDQLEPGEVYLGGGGLMRSASWGELLTLTAKERGAAGAVIDGWHRDTRAVRNERWPVFSRGSFGQDAGVRAQVVDFRVPVEIGGVRVQPGSLVVGDADGVVVVPADLEEEVVAGAVTKARKEGEVRAAIRAGLSSGRAWDRFGVL